MDETGLIDQLAALVQVLLVDLTLAGDNAVVVGMAVAGLPPVLRTRAIVVGIGAATVIRIGFAVITVKLLAIVGVLLAGGILLLWVCWKMYRELRATSHHRHGPSPVPGKTMRQAMLQIMLADVSMSLDNVLAVAGAAKGHLWVLVAGLSASVVMMGVAASVIARILDRYRWIAWIGLAIVLYIALGLIWHGARDVARHVQ